MSLASEAKRIDALIIKVDGLVKSVAALSTQVSAVAAKASATESGLSALAATVNTVGAALAARIEEVARMIPVLTDPGTPVVGAAPAPTPINVALAANGGVATASSSHSSGGYPASRANDGSRVSTSEAPGVAGYWNDNTSGVFPDWLQITFNGTKSIVEVDVFSLQDNYQSGTAPTLGMTFSLFGLTAFQIQYWTGSAWTDVPGGNVSSNNKVWRMFTFPAISTDRIRVLVNAAVDQWSRVVELEAWTELTGGAAPNNPPVWNLPATLAFTFGVPQSTNLVASGYLSDADGPNALVVTLTSGTLPVGVTLQSQGVLNYDGVGSGDQSQAVQLTASDGLDTAIGSVTLNVSATGAQLLHDGPATPEQISLYLDASAFPSDAVATCRYRVSGGAWVTGHNLYRIQPTFSDAPSTGTVDNAFCWPIIDLFPGVQYEVEVTVAAPGVSVVKTLTHTTRALPAAAGAPNKFISAGTSAASIQSTFNALVPGDVLQFANGTYDLSALTNGLQTNVGGTAAQPIYIRGESRAGVILTHPLRGIYLVFGAYLVFENFTIDSGAFGFNFWDGAVKSYITIRNMTIIADFQGIGNSTNGVGCLVYRNTLTGPGAWTAEKIDTTAMWDADGIRMPGNGNAIFENSITNFGDSMSFSMHSGGQTSTYTYGTHFYRNEIRNSCDDLTEVDYAVRNVSVYDNRCHNSMTFCSLDPLYGGPFLFARNIGINCARKPYKFNSRQSGYFIYNNTLVRTGGAAAPSEAGWYQPNNGAQKSYGYRNNLLIYRGGGTQQLRLDNQDGHNPIDFTNNSWYPNLSFSWPTPNGGTFSNLAAALSGLAATTQVFSGSTQRHFQDTITVSNPFTETITFGADYHTEITATFRPTLLAGDTAKASGVVIPNITDGYSTVGPDRGAIIEGRPLVTYGDNLPAWLPTAGTRADISLNTMTSVDPHTTPTCAWHGSGGQQAILSAWSGMTYAKDYGTYGSLLTTGGGHGDYFGNEVYRYDVESRLWTRITEPHPTLFDNGGYYASGQGSGSTDNFNGEYWTDGTFTDTLATQPSATHMYDHAVALPAGVGGAGVSGALLTVKRDALPPSGQRTGVRAHMLNLASPTWARFSSNLCPRTERGSACYVASLNKVFHSHPINSNTSNTLDVLNCATGAWSQLTLSAFTSQFEPGTIRSLDSLGLLIYQAGNTFYLINPTTGVVYTPGSTGTGPGGGTGGEWADSIQKYVVYPGLGGSVVYILSPPASPTTQPWVWTSQTITGPTPASAGTNPHYSRFRWVPSLGIFLWLAGTGSAVQAWKLTGT